MATSDVNFSKFVVFVDHCAEYNRYDCYITLDGNTIIEAMESFNKKINISDHRNTVYLYKMMQRKGHVKGNYRDILINYGCGWNPLTSPIEENLGYAYNLREEYIEN